MSCSENECTSPVAARGLCNRHYIRKRRLGELPKLSLSREDRFWAKVDRSGECWIWTASRKPNGYGEFYAGGRVGYAHRYSYEMHHGPIPEGMVVDHTCYTPACVNPDHLRLASKSQNGQNRDGLDVNNTSGYRGVSRDTHKRRWRASVGKDGKYYHGGTFDTAEEAAEAAKQLRAELFTHHQEVAA